MQSPKYDVHHPQHGEMMGVGAAVGGGIGPPLGHANSFNRLPLGGNAASHQGQVPSAISYDDQSRFQSLLTKEAEERRKAELKILELTSQLEDARRGLRETQNALLDVQHAAEVLTQKRDERNAQFQKILMENKTLEAKIFEMEMETRNSDKIHKNQTVQSEERSIRLQEELTTITEASHRHQSESTRNKTDKARLEAEVENLQRKIKSMETSFKHAELAFREEHEAEVPNHRTHTSVYLHFFLHTIFSFFSCCLYCSISHHRT